jgi:hypothetical protein
LAFVAKELSRFLTQPTQHHLAAAKQAFLYAYHTRETCLLLGKSLSNNNDTTVPSLSWTGLRDDASPRSHHPLPFYEHASTLNAFSDASWADQTDMKTTEGVLIRLGLTPIVWKSRVQRTVATSTCAAENRALYQTCIQLMPIKGMYSRLTGCSTPALVLCDNQGTIQAATNHSNASKLRHEKVGHAYTRDLLGLPSNI